MKGVFGKPYVCLDRYTNIPQLLNIVEDINYGIAKSHALIKPNFAATYQTDSVNELNKNAPKDFGSAYRCWLNDPDPIRQARGKSLLNTDQIAFEFWLGYEYKVMEMLTYIVIRDYDTPFAESYQPCDRLKPNNFNFKWTTAADNFSTLVQWCNQLPFKQLGPIVLLLKTAGDSFPLHKDVFFDNEDYTHQEQFIWFNPLGIRNLYMLDTEKNIKHNMLDGVSYYWNNHDLHGGIEAAESVSWTIRVEGIFEDWLVTDLSK
jgi:hypothetical protein